MTAIFTQDGTVIARTADISASGATRADAERRLAEKRNMDWQPVPSVKTKEKAV